MKVVPAVCVGLLGLFALKAGSVISRTGPAARSSLASRYPPGLPMSRRAAARASLGGANDGRLGKIRPKNSGDVDADADESAIAVVCSSVAIPASPNAPRAAAP